MDWFDLLVVQGTLKSLLQHHNWKASILWGSAFFVTQLSHPLSSCFPTKMLCVRAHYLVPVNWLSHLEIIKPGPPAVCFWGSNKIRDVLCLSWRLCVCGEQKYNHNLLSRGLWPGDFQWQEVHPSPAFTTCHSQPHWTTSLRPEVLLCFSPAASLWTAAVPGRAWHLLPLCEVQGCQVLSWAPLHGLGWTSARPHVSWVQVASSGLRRGIWVASLSIQQGSGRRPPGDKRVVGKGWVSIIQDWWCFEILKAGHGSKRDQSPVGATPRLSLCEKGWSPGTCTVMFVPDTPVTYRRILRGLWAPGYQQERWEGWRGLPRSPGHRPRQSHSGHWRAAASLQTQLAHSPL